ncbi:protein FANTASTIC FOUR 3-like [Rhodamnia argentea]|uniref:Protein FANTASTIC FOUR 3-like n=1 Tax=Rhodamnia argentea TaxID=178133 RepID=A0ABM3HJW7_9MYRT|nr:protein FANTASTIC FOUR 3-like [Rhodamnia argentea]
MATIVCQGLQSCLDSQIMEPMSVRLKLTSPSPPHFSQFLDVPSKSSPLGKSSKGSEVQNETPWMASNSLANPISPVNKQDFAYVPPMTKSSSSISLLEKSLAMCTEDLGNETGIVDHVSESMVLPSVPTGGSRSDENSLRPREHVGAKESMRRSFPPPLTTISGVKSLQVRPHREHGRLVIEAVKALSSCPHFRAERSDGRLRLCFLREPTSSCVDSIDDEGRMFDDDTMEDDEKDWEEDCVSEEEEVDDNDMRDDACGDVKGILQRTGRCKEKEPENRRLLTWEPSWVATS